MTSNSDDNQKRTVRAGRRRPAAHLNRKNASKPKLLNGVNLLDKAHTHHILARVEVVPALRGFRSGSCLAAEVVHPSWCC